MKIALIGNCQVQSLAVSAQHMLENVEIEMLDYSEPYSRDEEYRKRFAEGVGRFDFVFAQPAILSHTSEHDLRPLLGSKLVIISNFYFRGLFPDSCYIGAFGHRLEDPGIVHSLIVLDAFRRGLSEDSAVRAFNIENFERLGILDAWASSMHEMGRRETADVVDVPSAAFMENACRQYPAFLTMNHPSARLITDYFSKVLHFAGVAHTVPAPGTYPDALAYHDTTPVYDVIADHYGLRYRTIQTWQFRRLGRDFVSREDYVAACYHVYRGVDPSALIVHSPTDMVSSLRQSPHRFLVDGGVAAPQELATDPAAGGPRMLSAAGLARTLLPVEEKLTEISVILRSVHSHSQVMDPKVERLVEKLLDSGDHPVASALREHRQQSEMRFNVLQDQSAQLLARLAQMQEQAQASARARAEAEAAFSRQTARLHRHIRLLSAAAAVVAVCLAIAALAYGHVSR